MKFDDFKESKEYRLWEVLSYHIEEHSLRQTDIVSKKDIIEYWEPFLDLIYKLGNIFKQTGKLKELKVKWMRPIFYILEESKLTIDGIVYEPPKESMDNGQELKRRLGLFNEIVERFSKLDQTNFKGWKKDFQKLSGDLWKIIIKFVTKMGFRELNQTLKDILAPLLALRKASMNLFKLECQELGLTEFVMFNNSSDCQNYLIEIKNHLDREEQKLKRDIAPDNLEDYIKQVTTVENYMYAFDKDNYKSTFNNFSNKENKTDEFVKLKIRKDVLQTEFEKGLTGVFKYFNDKENEMFWNIPDVRKLFSNLEVDNADTLPLKYYIDDMKEKIADLKIMLYEMKCNGMSRIEIPIKANKNFTVSMKAIFDLHHKKDRLFGNKLAYDQFNFFYNCLFTIVHSNLKEEISILKNKEFMESAVAKYIILTAMRNSVRIEENMRHYAKEKGELFKRENYFQILNYQQDSEYNDYIYCYDVKRHPLFGTEKAQELNDIRSNLETEIKQYEGRYWVLEELISKEDLPEWIQAIEILRNINHLVQDDIRDFLLIYYKEKDLQKLKEKDHHKRVSSSSKKNVNLNSSSSIKHLKSAQKDTIKDKKKKKLYRQNSNQDKSFESEDEIILNKKVNLKYELLRPPFIWNFPTDKFKAKYVKELKEKEKQREKDNFEILKDKNDDELINTEIRKVDPRDFYKDGRINEFLNLLNILTEKLLLNSIKNKNDIFKFIMECTLNVFGISYYKKEE